MNPDKLFLGKFAEKLVAGQLQQYLTISNVLDPCQSGFTPTVTDFLMAMDTGQTSLQILLDLSPALDTFDCEVLSTHLQVLACVDRVALIVGMLIAFIESYSGCEGQLLFFKASYI